ncbi:MAG: hypothetical protein LIO74_06160 [Ruminococcus sp.]|nr:hypothetical protein [Ruminococcus sp.]
MHRYGDTYLGQVIAVKLSLRVIKTRSEYYAVRMPIFKRNAVSAGRLSEG